MQALLDHAKKTAMDCMFEADQAERELMVELNILDALHTSNSDNSFDSRAKQRFKWLEKNKEALQKRLMYQKALEDLKMVEEKWGGALGVDMPFMNRDSSNLSPEGRTVPLRKGIAGGRGDGAGTETICLWVVGLTAVHLTNETLGKAFYGCLSESDQVPVQGWIPFEANAGDLLIRPLAPRKVQKRNDEAGAHTWVVEGSNHPEVNGRFIESGTYDGIPRFQNPNKVCLFRHRLNPAKELGISRETWLPQTLQQEAQKPAARDKIPSPCVGPEIAANTMSFEMLVKRSLHIIKMDRKQEKALEALAQEAEVMARMDQRLQDQMRGASHAPGEVLDGGEIGPEGTCEALPSRDTNRELLRLANSDAPKLTYQDKQAEDDRVVPCMPEGAPLLCKRWVAQACPKKCIQCRCRHYFISESERETMLAWRQSRHSKAEITVLRCIAMRESLLEEARKEASLCSRNFLLSTRTQVEDQDVRLLVNILNQLRLASVKVVEAISYWQKDEQAVRLGALSGLENSNKKDLLPATEEGLELSDGEGERGDTQQIEMPQETAGPSPSSSLSVSEGQSSSMGRQKNDSSSTTASSQEKGIKLVHGQGVAKDNHSNVQRDTEGGLWAVTLSVPGRRLYESSPAVLSQYKRYRRSRQEPKIARDQVYLGLFSTKVEAIREYDRAVAREAIKQRSSVLRMPKKRILQRKCGKHYAVQSANAPLDRPCEQCAARALNGGLEYRPPFIWNNRNYVLKLASDLDFLSDVQPLVGWLGPGFTLKDNPFLLSQEECNPSVHGDDILGQEDQRGTCCSSQPSMALQSSSTPVTCGPGPSPSHRFDEKMDTHVHPLPPALMLHSANRPESTSSVASGTMDSVGLLTGAYNDADQVGSRPEVGVGDGVEDERLQRILAGTSRQSFGRTSTQVKSNLGFNDSIYNFTPPHLVLPYSRINSTKIPHHETVHHVDLFETAQVTRFNNGVTEWGGAVAMGGRFPVLLPPNRNPSHDVPVSLRWDEGMTASPRPEQGVVIHVLDSKRVAQALAMVQDEQDIADALEGKPPRERSTFGLISPRGGDHRQEVEKGGSDKKGEDIEGDVPTTGKEDHNQRGLKEGRGVMVVYKDRGARLTMPQRREQHPFQQKGVFCRADRGEWAGQVHMSLNAKKFVARCLLDKSLERMQMERVKIGRIMRRLVEQGKPIYRLRASRLRQLLAKAKSLGGDRLALDMMEVENTLATFDKVEHIATRVQTEVRGFLARRRVAKAMKEMRNLLKLQRKREECSGNVAAGVTMAILEAGARKTLRTLRRPRTASVRCFTDGRRRIVSSTSLEHSVLFNATKTALEWQQLCNVCKGSCVRSIWSFARGKEETFRGVCSCRTQRTPEKIRITAYDPITGEEIHLVASESAARRCIQKAEIYRQKSLAHVPLVASAAHLQPLPWDNILGYGDPTRETGVIRRTCWEPSREARWTQQVATWAEIKAKEVARALHSVWEEEQAVSVVVSEEAARAKHEICLMTYEDVTARHLALVMDFLDSSEKSRKALAFSWKSVQQIENREAEDWTQSWDPFENGNNWKQLVRRRRADLALASAVQAKVQAWKAGFVARAEWCACKHRRRDVAERVRRLREMEKIESAQASKFRVAATEANVTALSAMTQLTKLVHPTVKATGILKQRLVFIDHSRNGELQWDTLFCAGMTVHTPHLAYLCEKEQRHYSCILTVQRDGSTGRVTVTATGKNKASPNATITMTPAEVQAVVREQAGRQRGRELVLPIEMDGGYAAIHRVQEARKKEVVQVLVAALKLDIHRGSLVVGQLFYHRDRTSLHSKLKNTLWFHDAVAKRRSSRGHEVFRGFRRIGSCRVLLTVYENWGDLLFETYDPALASAASLEVSLTEVLMSLSSDLSAAAAYLYAVRLGFYPPKLMHQVVDLLDFSLPGEMGHWWRRQIDGEEPHLKLLPDVLHKYRGPIWMEDRFTSGKAVHGSVFISSRGDFLVEISPRKATFPSFCSGTKVGEGASGDVGLSGGTRGVENRFSGPPLRVEVRGEDLRRILSSGTKTRASVSGGTTESICNGLLSPGKRAELCRYLLAHVVLVEAGEVLSSSINQKHSLQIAYKSFQEWTKATKAPVELDPLGWCQETSEGYNLSQQPGNRDYGYEDQHDLLFHPHVKEDDHLLALHERQWSPDGSRWFVARVCFLEATNYQLKQDEPMREEGTELRGPAGSLSTVGSPCDAGKGPFARVTPGSGLSVILRPETTIERRARVEADACAAMTLEDEQSHELEVALYKLKQQSQNRAREVARAQTLVKRTVDMANTEVRAKNRLNAIAAQMKEREKAWVDQDAAAARRTASSLYSALRL
ncbi:unnamed protein product, partial [Discosporangium mesarthrocarpum]